MKTIFFYIIVITCTVLLFLFTASTTMEYTRNLIEGYAISAVVFLSYPLILHRSYMLFTQNRVGLAFFLVIGFFFILAFIQMIGCSGSTVWMH